MNDDIVPSAANEHDQEERFPGIKYRPKVTFEQVINARERSDIRKDMRKELRLEVIDGYATNAERGLLVDRVPVLRSALAHHTGHDGGRVFRRIRGGIARTMRRGGRQQSTECTHQWNGSSVIKRLTRAIPGVDEVVGKRASRAPLRSSLEHPQISAPVRTCVSPICSLLRMLPASSRFHTKATENKQCRS